MSTLTVHWWQNNDPVDLTALLADWVLREVRTGHPSRDRLWYVMRDGAALAALRARRGIGMMEPRFWYHLGCRVHAAPELGMFRRERTLLLGNDHTGACELSEFAFAARLTNDEAADEAVAVARALIEAVVHQLLSETVEPGECDRIIASLPGRRLADASAPFWSGLGQRFFAGDVDAIKHRHGTGWEALVAALLPRHPLVASILSDDAQAAIAEPGPMAQPWLAALAGFGFESGQHIAIHDGGPVWEASFQQLRAMQRLGRRAS